MSDNEYGVMQDFHNKRANAHASLFVASMFGLFGLLSLMGRILERGSLYFETILVLLIVSYLSIFAFGLYSLLNFFFFATVAQDAESRIVRGRENDLIEVARRRWSWVLRAFLILKPIVQGWFGTHKETIFVFMYGVIGLLPLIAFMIWLFT